MPVRETLHNINYILSLSAYESPSGSRHTYQVHVDSAGMLIVSGSVHWERHLHPGLTRYRVQIDPRSLAGEPAMTCGAGWCLVRFSGESISFELEDSPSGNTAFWNPCRRRGSFSLVLPQSAYQAAMLRSRFAALIRKLSSPNVAPEAGRIFVHARQGGGAQREIQPAWDEGMQVRVIAFSRNFDGTFQVPVVINEVLELDFLFDSGASEVTIPSHVASRLVRSGTVRSEDWLPEKTYLFANGSEASSPRFRAQSLQIGPYRIEDVEVAVAASERAPILLGQNVINRFGKVMIDNERHRLLITPREWPSQP